MNYNWFARTKLSWITTKFFSLFFKLEFSKLSKIYKMQNFHPQSLALNSPNQIHTILRIVPFQFSPPSSHITPHSSNYDSFTKLTTLKKKKKKENFSSKKRKVEKWKRLSIDHVPRANWQESNGRKERKGRRENWKRTWQRRPSGTPVAP